MQRGTRFRSSSSSDVERQQLLFPQLSLWNGQPRGFAQNHHDCPYKPCPRIQTSLAGSITHGGHRYCHLWELSVLNGTRLVKNSSCNTGQDSSF
jgi:hypothetical protein